MPPLHNPPLCSSTVRSQVVWERIKYSSPSANSNYELRVIGTVLAKLFIFNSVHKTCPHFLLFCLFVAYSQRGSQRGAGQVVFLHTSFLQEEAPGTSAPEATAENAAVTAATAASPASSPVSSAAAHVAALEAALAAAMQHDGSKRGYYDSRSRGYSGYSGYWSPDHRTWSQCPFCFFFI